MRFWNSRTIVRSSALALLVVSAAAASAQKTFSFPHVLESKGTLMGIAWNLTGGQPVLVERDGKPVPGFNPFEGLFSLYGNDPVYQILQGSLAGKTQGNTYAMYGIQKAARVQEADGFYIKIATFPSCDSSQKEARGTTMVWDSRSQFSSIMDASKMMAEAARKQKTWLCSNFRLSIGNLPASRCVKTDPITVHFDYATDPAGGITVTSSTDGFSCYIPVADAGPFQEAVKQTAAGQPTDFPMELDYLDDDGNIIMALTCTVQIWGSGPSDIFADPNSPTATVKVDFKKVGHVSLLR